MGIRTNIKSILQRSKLSEEEEKLKSDLITANKDKLKTDISQRRGLSICSGLSIAERDYILSDSMIASAMQLYLSDIQNIIKKDTVIIRSDIPINDEYSDLAKKEEIVKTTFNFIYSDRLIEAIALNLLNNGEIFIETKYNRGLNKIQVNETAYSRCTQLCFSDGEVATYLASNEIQDNNRYNYSITSSSSDNLKMIEPQYMVRIYNPTLINSKVLISLDDEDKKNTEVDGVFKNELYYTNSQSLLRQIYPDWLNSKLLELAVYRDRIAKSRFIQLIGLELGRLGRETSDKIYDSVKDYFDAQAVIDLEKQTFKSVVGDEPFTEYKIFTTRNGNGQLTFDNSLNGNNPNVASLADLDYNLTKLFAGLGIPKQYLGADDNGSALSNGGSLFFMSEEFQKRVITYVKRIANGFKDICKNIIIQKEGKEFFNNWDFILEFQIPENNEDIYRAKNARLDYANALIDIIDKARQENISLDVLGSYLNEDISKFINNEETGKEEI